MSAPVPSKRVKGIGRVAFLAQLAEITADLDAGWSAKVVYQRRADRLGISYVQFTRYVDRLIRQGDRARAATRAPAPSASPLPVPVPYTDSGGTPYAGHQPARRTFNHDPIERPDDRRRLLGEE